MKVAIGTGRHQTMQDIVELATTAEACGFSQLQFLDDISLSRDVYVMLTAAAMATSKIHLGQSVTHPYTRHPIQTAVATASVHELSGGRAFLGIGAGHLYRLIGMERDAAKIADVREVIEVARGLSRGEEVTLQNGAKVVSPWMKEPFPIFVGTEGPRSLQLAGELGDGIWLTGLFHPSVIQWRLENIEKGAELAKRSRGAMQIWQRAAVVITDDQAAGRDEARGFIATLAHQFALAVLGRDTPETHRLKASMPDDLLSEYDRIAESWDPTEHEKYDARHAVDISDRLVDLHAIIGPPDYVAQRLNGLVDDWRFDGIVLSAYTIRDVNGLMRRFSNEVMPLLK